MEMWAAVAGGEGGRAGDVCLAHGISCWLLVTLVLVFSGCGWLLRTLCIP